MGFLLYIGLILYSLSAMWLAVFTTSFGVLLFIYMRKRRTVPILPEVNATALPAVTIQLPIYNEVSVVTRLIDACMKLDYPADKLHIQILDDSTDETSEQIEVRIAEWRLKSTVKIEHIQRIDRQGYKAGALAYGMMLVQTPYVAIFDADFIPSEDFLQKTMPYFVDDSGLGLVQTRWGHLNESYNWLTRAQALSIDGHFAIEQVARNRGNLPMSMNGTGGIWRVVAIDDAGGWSDKTLTEDLDLSYRALMKGWHFLYLVDIAVPGELPVQVQAYKLQQARWATGSTECLIQHVPALMRTDTLTWGKKLMGVMHLSQYAVQPLILLLFLLTPILLITDMFAQVPDLRFLAIIGIIPPFVIALAQYELHADWRKRLLYFPVQFMVAAAIVLNNSYAVLQAVVNQYETGQKAEFKRTPKFSVQTQGQIWTTSRYALKADWLTIGEFLLGLYALWGVFVALDHFPALVPYMGSYAISLIVFALWNWIESAQVNRDLS
ncbi:MAG: glycosyltransferase [Aggregatilineales bacterium]